MITLVFMHSDLESPCKLVGGGTFHSPSQISSQIPNYADRTMSNNNFQEECRESGTPIYNIFHICIVFRFKMNLLKIIHHHWAHHKNSISKIILKTKQNHGPIILNTSCSV